MTKTNTNKTNFLPFIFVGLGLLVLIGIAVYVQGGISENQSVQDPFLLPPIEVDQPAPELTLLLMICILVELPRDIQSNAGSSGSCGFTPFWAPSNERVSTIRSSSVASVLSTVALRVSAHAVPP